MESPGTSHPSTTKKCPFCAEEILSEAVKCKHCGEFLDEQSLHELSVSKKTDRRVFSIEEVADYLRVPQETIEQWVKRRRMPFSHLPGGTAVFHRKDIDEWISQDRKVTAYHKFVADRKTVDDVLPKSFKPLSPQEEVGEIIAEIHEKWVAKHCRKSGEDETKYARALKESLRSITMRAPDKTRIKWEWSKKKRRLVMVQGKEAYDRYLKKDEKLQGAIGELNLVLTYLSKFY